MKKENNLDNKLLRILNNCLKKYNKKANIKIFKLSLYKDGTIDSFDFINLIGDIEKEFKIKIPLSKLDANTTINKIKNEIKKI